MGALPLKVAARCAFHKRQLRGAVLTRRRLSAVARQA